MLNKDFIIGGDPEFFCKDVETQEYISLIPYIKGTKLKPQKIKIEGCSQLRDGVSIELNLPPVPEFWMLHRIISDCIDYTNNWLRDINPNYKLDITSSAFFSEDQLNHREARTFGCDPAYNAYTTGECPRPEPDSLDGLRTASYHLHYGWENPINVDSLRHFIFLNDLFLGFPAMYLDHSDKARKSVYGSLGEHRIKKAGESYHDIIECNRIEYRSLGAGIHQFPGFIEKGIDMIKNAIDDIDTYINLYYEDMVELSLRPTEELKEKLKEKLIKNGHYNR